MGVERKREKPADTEVTQEDVKPKKLRLIVREKTLENHLAQIGQKDTDFSIRVLLEVRNFFPLNLGDSELLFSRLLSAYPTLARETHRLYVIEILSRVLDEAWFPPTFPVAVCLNQISSIVEQEDDNEAIAAWLSVIRRLIARDIADENSAESAVALVMAERLVKSDFWKIRAESLEIITHSAIKRNRRNEGGDRKSERFRSQTEVPLLRLNATMTTISKPTGKKELKTELTVPITSSRHLPYEKILIGFTTDLEPRVRAKAVELLLLTIESGLDVTVGSYDSLCPLLQDDDDVVRRLTAKLIWRFARLFPEDCVKGPHDGVELRLLDDAFGKLCGCMHDTSVEVRKDSAEYLGSLDNVSQKFLEQTLDKKLMPKMRLMRAGAQRTGREGVPVYSDFATGRVFGADAPAEKVEEDSASLIPSGSCGAFITGLEDEYTVVREASVVAVGKLALKSQKFSILALDFLADMFNDEIDAVRLRSIGCLKRICENIELKEEQIEIVLKALDEFSSDSRNAVRELLSVCRLSTISCLRLVVDSLLANLKRYSSDKKSIWNCLRHLGANHPGIVAVITPDLLEIHPFFETAEPDMDSPAYIGILILVINAAAICPAIKAIFLHHTWRHYEYLRHSLPELVPCLTAALRDQTNLDNKGSVLKQLSAMLEESKAKLVSIRHLTGEAKLVVLELLARDMQRIGEFASGTTMEGQAAFLLLFMRCQFALEKIHSKGQSVGTSSCNTHVDSQFQQIVDVFKLALQLEYLFNGASIEASQCVTDLKLRSAALLFVRRPDCFPIFSRSLQNALRTGSQLGSKLLEQNITEATVQSSSLCSILVASPYVLPFPVANVQLKREPEESVSVSSYQLERLKTEIIEPTPEAEQIYRFTAGLVAAINFVANFSGFNEALLKRIRIRVLYPDQKSVLVRPRVSQFHQLEVNSTKTLRTQVLLSHSVWTEANSVQLQLVLVVPEDFDTPSSAEWCKEDLQYLELSEVIRVKVQPKAKC